MKRLILLLVFGILIFSFAFAEIAFSQEFINIIYPNGGEVLEQGWQVTILWNSSTPGIPTYVGLNLLQNDSQLLGFGAPNTGSYVWTVPTNFSGSGFKFKIFGNGVWDYSDEPFNISPPLPPSITVVSPNGGEIWEAGKTYQIRWDSTGIPPDANINIQLLYRLTDGTTQQDVIVTLNNNSGVYNWNIPSSIVVGRQPNQYKIRVVCNSCNPLIWDYSDGPFIISLTDLVVTNISAPSVASTGQQINVTWTVSNLGSDTTQALGEWYDALYISTDNTLNQNDTYLAETQHLAPLLPGQDYTVTQNITLPRVVTGTYYLIVQTDSRNAVFEFNEGNNVLAAGPITLGTFPCVPVVNTGDPARKLDIVFIGDGYSQDQLARFASDVDTHQNTLLSTEPFASNSNRINVWRVDAFPGLQCQYGTGNYSRLITCNNSRAERLALDCPVDEIVVVVNNGTYGGAGYRTYVESTGTYVGAGLATTYRGNDSEPQEYYGSEVIVHEFGHSFGGLDDEYITDPNCITSWCIMCALRYSFFGTYPYHRDYSCLEYLLADFDPAVTPFQAPPYPIYSLVLNRNVEAIFSLRSLEVTYGYRRAYGRFCDVPPATVPPPSLYYEVRDFSNFVLFNFSFRVPNSIFYPPPLPGQDPGHMIYLDNVNFTLLIPYFYNAKTINIYNYTNELLLSVDVSPPHITILSPQNTTYSSTSIPLTFTVNKQTSWCGYSLDGGVNISLPNCTNTILTVSYDSHNIIVFANDTSGNMGNSSKVYFTVLVPTTTTTTTRTTTTTIRRNGGGCPILKVNRDNKFVTIEKLNIHSPKNQDTTATSTFTMQPVNGKYEIILDEAAYLFWDGSHIDNVKLTDETGKECKLTSATHSKLGDVLSLIANSDDLRVRSYPGDRIKLTYNGCSGNEFSFSVEGYNMKCAICPPI